MKSLNTRFLTVLTTLAFLGFSVSVLAGKKCEAEPNHPSCGGGGGGQPILYDVNNIGGDLVYGTKWESGNTGSIEWGQFWPAGTGFVDLSYFADTASSPFRPDRGANCFENNLWVPMVGGGFSQQTNGSAWGRLWFDGRTDDDNRSVRYMLTLEGQFADPGNSFPSESGYNELTMMTWKMEIEGGGKRIRNISCIGAGNFEEQSVVIKIVEIQ